MNILRETALTKRVHGHNLSLILVRLWHPLFGGEARRFRALLFSVAVASYKQGLINPNPHCLKSQDWPLKGFRGYAPKPITLETPG